MNSDQAVRQYVKVREDLWNYRKKRGNLFFDSNDETEKRILYELERIYINVTDDRDRNYLQNSGIQAFYDASGNT